MTFYTLCQIVRMFVVLYAVAPLVSSLLDIPGMDIIDLKTDNVRMLLKDVKHRTFDNGVHYTAQVCVDKS